MALLAIRITRTIIKEWSPLVIVLDSAMERVMKLDIKVDVLLGDFDRDFD
jgi:thiamine pyrophosphokinase